MSTRRITVKVRRRGGFTSTEEELRKDRMSFEGYLKTVEEESHSVHVILLRRIFRLFVAGCTRFFCTKRCRETQIERGVPEISNYHMHE